MAARPHNMNLKLFTMQLSDKTPQLRTMDKILTPYTMDIMTIQYEHNNIDNAIFYETPQ